MADAHLPVQEAFAAWDADKYTLTTDSSSAITTATKLCVRLTLSVAKDDAFEGVPAWLEQTLDCDISLGDLDAAIGTFLDVKGFVRKEAAPWRIQRALDSVGAAESSCPGAKRNPCKVFSPRFQYDLFHVTAGR